MKKNYATYVMLLSILLTATTYAQTPDFNLSVTNIVISENDRPLTNVSESISITMVSQPTNDVVVTPVYTDQTEFSVSPSTLTFTASNWNVAQSFTFTSINDNIVDGDVSMNITMTATTSSSHDSGSGDGSHDSGSGDGSHDSGSGDGSHDSGSGDGSHDSGSGDGSHDSGSGDGSHDSGSGDGSSDATTEKNLSITILDYNQPPSNIADFAVKIGFNTEDYILVSISDPDGDQISLNTTKALDSGTVSLETGNLLYSPNKKFFGSDTLGIKFTDAIFTTNQTTIDIDVIGLGDMNGDGSVSAVDLVFLASNAVGITGYEIPDTFNNVFDVNQDGVVNTVDLVYLASYMVGIDGYNLTIK
jgi:hypothetical protein